MFRYDYLSQLIIMLLLYLVSRSIYFYSFLNFKKMNKKLNILDLLKEYFKNKDKLITTNTYDDDSTVVKIGLLTNEIPPVVHGGVATWILNFLDMFKDSKEDNIQIIPIFLAYEEKHRVHLVAEKYLGIRIINEPSDIKKVFSDIDICVNNLWVALDSIKQIKNQFPNIQMLTVCHSLIQMEHLTNLGSQYTSNFEDQESTIKNTLT